MEKITQLLSLFLIAAAPLALGLVHTGSLLLFSVLSVLVFILQCLVYAERPRGLLWAFAALTIWPLFQLITLPPRLLSLLAPHTREVLEASLGTLSSWHPISLAPGATALQWIRICGLCALLVTLSHQARSKRFRHQILMVLAATGSGIAGLGFVHRLLGLESWLGLFRSAIPAFLPSPFGNANHAAGTFNVAGLIALGLAHTAWRRGTSAKEGARKTASTPSHAQQRASGKRAKPFLRSAARKKAALLWFGASMLCFAATLTTSSRGGILALAIGLTAFWLLQTLSRTTKSKGKHRKTVALLVTAAALPIFGGNTKHQAPTSRSEGIRKAEIRASDAGSVGVGASELGSSGIGSTGIQSPRAGSTGVGSAVIRSPGTGSAGVGSEEIRSAGAGSSGLRAAGRQSPGTGSTGAESTGSGSTGSGSTGSGSTGVGSRGVGSAGNRSTKAGSAELGASEVGSALPFEQSGAHRPAQQNLGQRSHFETIPAANTRVFSPALSLLEQEGKLLPIGAGWRALLAQRWLGIGAGAFGSAHPIYLKAPSKVSFSHVESEGLQALAELGILWGTALILLVLLALTKLFRMALEGTSAAIASFTAAVALLVQNLADFSLQFSGGVWLMAMLALGLAVERRAGRKFSKNRVAPESRGRFSVLLPGTAALLLMLLLSPLALADLEKNSRKLSSELLSAQSLADIESALRRAQRLYPADSVLPLMAASVALQHQAPQRALSWSNTALLLAPYSGQAHLQAARAFVMLKKDDQALLHYRLALEMGESSTSEVLEHFGDVPSLISATPATLEASVHAAQQLFELRRFAEGLALLERDDGLSPLAPPPTKPCRDLEAPPSSDGLEGSSASGMESSDSESGSSVSGNELPVLERQNSVFEDAVPILGPQNSVAGDEVSAFGADISASEDVISVAGNEIPVLGPQNSVFGDGFAVLGAENSASGDEISGFGDEISVSGHEPSVPEGQSSVSRNEKDLKDSAFRRECGEMDAEMESKSVSPGLLRASEGRPGAPPFCIPTHLHHTPPLSSTTLRAFHYLRAVFAWHENRLELASQSANCLKLMAGEAPEGWLLEVEILRKKKDWDAAVERMVDARRKFPESTEVALAHARLLLAASEPEQAWTVLEALPPTMQPQLLAERHALRATVWLLRQQDEKAGEELKQAIELAPERRDLRSLWEERLKNRSRR